MPDGHCRVVEDLQAADVHLVVVTQNDEFDRDAESPVQFLLEPLHPAAGTGGVHHDDAFVGHQKRIRCRAAPIHVFGELDNCVRAGAPHALGEGGMP